MPAPNSTALIDALRAPDGSLDRDAIRTILPYGDAFLFVDRVTHLTADAVEATYRVPHDAPYVQAHFRHTPIMPGVLTGEGMAQAGVLLIRYRLDLAADVDVLVMHVDNAVFSAPAVPCDTLVYKVTLKHAAAYAARLIARADVGDRQICSARLAVMFVDRERLRQMTARP